ncbi:MAG: exonuclease domain-containing protein [Gammaproteobacteria bacterium]
MKKTFLFYDIETSGRNPAFDQILQFAAIRTDLNLNELERHELLIKLLPDAVPAPRAQLIHQIPLSASLSGTLEIEAMQQIHQWVNTPGTISIGYNNLSFDDEFLRFAFYRNLLPPYTHQYANQCGRADLYPILLLYFLFKPDVLHWPERNGKPSLKLEHLSKANQLAEGPAHQAITDVLATLALARRLAKESDIWQYALDYFEKKTATERTNKLTQAKIGSNSYPLALYVDGSLGYELQFICPVLGLGSHRHYKNQTLWLRLDKPELTATTTENLTQTTWVMRKKINETGFLLPMQPRFLQVLGAERQTIMAHNQNWLNRNSDLLEKIVEYYLEYRYPEIPNLDIDAALYQIGFYSDGEQSLCVRFHQELPDKKILFIDKFQNPNLRAQAIRLIARHYFEHLPEQYREEYLAYLQKVNPQHPNEAPLDFRGEHRLTPKAALQEIAELKSSGDLTSKQIELLNELEQYLRGVFLLSDT